MGIGHSYYYNAATKESTYTRPSALPTSQTNQAADEVVRGRYQLDLGAVEVGNRYGPGLSPFGGIPYGAERFQNHHNQRSEVDRGRGGYEGSSWRKPSPVDRPKSKHIIPGCTPWLLVKTKLGRRFVYNPEEGQSYWKFPTEVMKCLIEYDRAEREKKERGEPDEKIEPEDERDSAFEERVSTGVMGPVPATPNTNIPRAANDSDESEEVEVTDEEDEDSLHKRQKTDGDTEEGAVEFNEDDIAYQLAAMGQDYGLDPGEYGNEQDEDLEEGAEGLPLTEEDSQALFKDLLDDHHISPYKPWEKIIEEGQIIEDDRYTVLTNMKARKEAWGEWSRERIQCLKEQREQEEKKDPRILYLAFLQRNATPKLYWPEFRRKYKKEAAMRDVKFTDKEREKWYRDYINRKVTYCSRATVSPSDTNFRLETTRKHLEVGSDNPVRITTAAYPKSIHEPRSTTSGTTHRHTVHLTTAFYPRSSNRSIYCNITTRAPTVEIVSNRGVRASKGKD